MGRNYGSQDSQGAKVKIRLDLNEKKKDGGWIKKYAEGGIADVEMSAPEPMAPEPAKHIKNKRKLIRRNRPAVISQQASVSNPIEDVVPNDKHLLTQVPIAAEPTYSPDLIQPWESWNPMRWGKYDYSDYPNAQLANSSAFKKLGNNEEYVYKKQILATKPEEKKEEVLGSSTYDEAYNKYYNFVKENEGTVKDKKTGLFIPYPSPEGGGYTIGYGHKLDEGDENKAKYKNGLTEEEVEELFKKDFNTHYNNAKKAYGKKDFVSLPYDQQMMFTDYNLYFKRYSWFSKAYKCNKSI